MNGGQLNRVAFLRIIRFHGKRFGVRVVNLRQRYVIGVLVGIGLMVYQGVYASPGAQISVSATPIQVQLPSANNTTGNEIVATETPTRTPTPVGNALLEAITEANVRAEPDLDAEKLGTIRSGETYSILGRYYRWLQFQYDKSPSGTGWVFDELVTIIGDQTTIPDLNVNALPTVDAAAVDATATWDVITRMPGGILTATADARILPAPGLEIPNPGQGGNDIALPQVLPTFTWPPELAAARPTSTPTPADAAGVVEDIAISLDNGVAPFVPILALAGLGIFGLLISSVRRR